MYVSRSNISIDVLFCVKPSPMLSPHHQMKSPVIDSLSEGSDEFLLVGDSQTTITGGNTKNEPVSSDQVDHQGDTVVELPLSDDGEEQPVSSGGGQQSQKDVLVSRQLDQVRRDLQSILHRLNSLEVLLQRRRVSSLYVCVDCSASMCNVYVSHDK